MDAPQKTEIVQPTPEQLLKLLDLQLAQERSKRANKSRNRATFLVVGILTIVAAAGVALIVAQGLLTELQDRGVAGPVPSEIALEQ